MIWGMLRNPAYAGRAVFGKTQIIHAQPGLNRIARLQGRTVPRPVKSIDRPWEAATAGVSRSWLYRQADLRQIDQLRQTEPASTSHAADGARQSSGASLARLNQVLERNRQLADDNARLRRQLAQSTRRATQPPRRLRSSLTLPQRSDPADGRLRRHGSHVNDTVLDMTAQVNDMSILKAEDNRRQRQPLDPAALAADRHLPAAPVDIGQFQAGDLGAAPAQPREHGRDRQVAAAGNGAGIAARQQPRDHRGVQSARHLMSRLAHSPSGYGGLGGYWPDMIRRLMIRPIWR